MSGGADMPIADARALSWDDLRAWSEDGDFERGSEAAARVVHATASVVLHGYDQGDGRRFHAAAWIVASDVEEYFKQHTPSTRPVQQALLEIASLMDLTDKEINGATDAPSFVTHATVTAIQDAYQNLGRAIEDWRIGLERKDER